MLGVALLLVGLPAAQDLLVVLVVVLVEIGQPTRRGGALVELQCPGERPRAGQEALLEQHRHDVARAALAVGPRALGEDAVERGEPLLLVVGRRERRSTLICRRWKPFSGELGLEPAHRHLAQRPLVEHRAPAEPASVDHLQQRGERLGVAVVRRRGQEQAVLAPLGQRSGGRGAVAVDGIAAPPARRGRARRGDVVRLVDHENVEGEPTGEWRCRARRRTRCAAGAAPATTAARPC